MNPDVTVVSKADQKSLEEEIWEAKAKEHDRQREERRYRDRRERFALACFRAIIQREEGSKLTDWRMLAKEAVQAADALEEELNPDTGPILPEYVP